MSYTSTTHYGFQKDEADERLVDFRLHTNNNLDAIDTQMYNNMEKIVNDFGTRENGNTATAAHQQYRYFTFKGVLHQAISTIAAGDTIISSADVGSGYNAVPVSITSLLNKNSMVRYLNNDDTAVSIFDPDQVSLIKYESNQANIINYGVNIYKCGQIGLVRVYSGTGANIEVTSNNVNKSISIATGTVTTVNGQTTYSFRIPTKFEPRHVTHGIIRTNLGFGYMEITNTKTDPQTGDDYAHIAVYLGTQGTHNGLRGEIVYITK